MRINYNNNAGQLGAPALTANATTINFAVAPTFATLNAPDYVKIVLDPPSGPTPNPSFEVVYLTAYTAGGISGTITRGQEGTQASAHNVGAVWACTPTVFDLLGQPPVGSIVPYAGSVDPPETNWVGANGRYIDRTVYADFFNRVGHAFNGGVDPGNNQVKIPNTAQCFVIGKAASGTGSVLGSYGGSIDHIHSIPALTIPSLPIPQILIPQVPVSIGGHIHTLSANGYATLAIGSAGSATALLIQALAGSFYGSYRWYDNYGWAFDEPGAGPYNGPGLGGSTDSDGASGSLNAGYYTPTGYGTPASGYTTAANTYNTGTQNPPWMSANYLVRIA